MASRLEVLSRQLSAAGLSDDFAAVCPQRLGAYISHGNEELRQAIFEFLRVSAEAPWGCGAPLRWRAHRRRAPACRCSPGPPYGPHLRSSAAHACIAASTTQALAPRRSRVACSTAARRPHEARARARARATEPRTARAAPPVQPPPTPDTPPPSHAGPAVPPRLVPVPAGVPRADAGAAEEVPGPALLLHQGLHARCAAWRNGGGQGRRMAQRRGWGALHGAVGGATPQRRPCDPQPPHNQPPTPSAPAPQTPSSSRPRSSASPSATTPSPSSVACT